MKKKIIFLFIPILVLVSCTKDFITKDPLGVGSDVTFFDTKEQCRQAVNAIYDPLGWQALYGRKMMVFDMLSDEAEKGGNPASLTDYNSDQSPLHGIMLGNASPLNGELNAFWESYYTLIARANLMLQKTVKFNGVKEYDEMRAEARFLRAFAYMDLVKIFGAVPLVKIPVKPAEADLVTNREYGEENKTADAQIDEIYNFIITELNEIKGVLPLRQPDTNFGMVTDAAVQAYLAKAYLYTRNFQKAYEVANTLIQVGQGQYGLEAAYHKVFDFDKYVTEYTIKEIIFSVQHIPGLSGDASDRYGLSEGTTRVIDQNPRVFLNDADVPVPIMTRSTGYGLIAPTQTLVDAFEVGDPRLDMIAKAAYTDKNGGEHSADSVYWKIAENGQDKYLWLKCAKNNFSTGNNTMKMFLNHAVFSACPKDQAQGKDLILMRWAEVLLIGAEAAIRTGNTADATEWVNQIRKRARNSKCTKKAPTMAGYTFEKGTVPADITTVTLDDVKKERQMELFCENGTRYFDLVRWNKDNDDMISYNEIMAKITTDLTGAVRKNYSSKDCLMPIPAGQITLHKGKLIQNKGY